MLFFDRDALMQSAAHCVAKGKLEKAVAKYRKILSRKPDDKEALGLAGDLLIQLGNKKVGFQCLDRAAALYLESGEWAKAITVYNKMLRHDPENETLMTTVADIYQQKEKTREAVEVLLKAAKVKSKTDPSKAIYFLERVTRLAPDNLEALEILADHYDKQKLTGRARDCHLAAGKKYFERGEFARCCLHLYEIIQAEPDNREVSLIVLQALVKLGSHEDALVLLNSMGLGEEDPDPQLMPYRISLLFELEKKDELIGLLHKHFMISPKGDEILFQYVERAIQKKRYGLAMDMIGILDLSRYHEYGGKLTDILQRILAEDEGNTQALQKLAEFKMYVGDIQAVQGLYPKLYEMFVRQSENRKAYQLLEKWLNLDESNEWVRHEMRRLKLALDEESYGKMDLIRGKLEEIGLEDVIQMLESARKTGILRIRFADREGHVYFNDGNMFHAIFKEKIGQHAIIELKRLKGGDFMFDPKLPENPPETLRGSNMAIVLEALRVIDEEAIREKDALGLDEITL
ncbi:MAG: DUF4388 domain-containing protein [Acidobacteria bacterium]|nr:DUF4388 domain-containing protein [Acidobacteriota bacterium]